MVKPISSGKRRGGSAGRRDGKVITVSSGISVGRGIDPTATHEGHGIDGLAIWKRSSVTIHYRKGLTTKIVNITVIFPLGIRDDLGRSAIHSEIASDIGNVVVRLKEPVSTSISSSHWT